MVNMVKTVKETFNFDVENIFKSVRVSNVPDGTKDCHDFDGKMS